MNGAETCQQACIDLGPVFLEPAQKHLNFAKCWAGNMDDNFNLGKLADYEALLRVKRKSYATDLEELLKADPVGLMRFVPPIVKAMHNALDGFVDATGYSTLIKSNHHTSI